MSYVMADPGGQRRRPRAPLVIGIVVVVIAAAVVAFVLGRHQSAPPAVAPAPTGQHPVPDGHGGNGVTWSRVADTIVPVSAAAGPHVIHDGVASGYARTTLGAVIAAINISSRLTTEAGPIVYTAVANQQCYGGVQDMITAIQNSAGSSSDSSALPTAYWYRIVNGSAASGVLVLAIAAQTPQSQALGGYVQYDRTVQWQSGDWRLQVPPAQANVITSTAGYTLLGRP